MSDKNNLYRFVEAQGKSYKIACYEVSKGRKTSHWMWYIFPQLLGLGKSSTSVFYSIQNIKEATQYLEHPVLGERLKEISNILLKVECKSARKIFGGIDSKKLKSSMTLFSIASDDSMIFDKVLYKYFDGKKSRRTIELLKKR